MQSTLVQVALKLSVASCIVAAVAACGDKAEDSAANELDGTWVTACISKESDSGEVESYSKTEMVISGTTATTTSSDYDATDTTCAKTATMVVNATATMKVGADLTTPKGAKEIDVTPTKVTLTVKSAESIEMFNTAKVCGFSDWAADTAKDITAADCEGDGGKMSDTSYDIYDIDGTTLKLGESSDELDGSTAAKRPTSLSTKDEVYTKK